MAYTSMASIRYADAKATSPVNGVAAAAANAIKYDGSVSNIKTLITSLFASVENGSLKSISGLKSWLSSNGVSKEQALSLVSFLIKDPVGLRYRILTQLPFDESGKASVNAFFDGMGGLGDLDINSWFPSSGGGGGYYGSGVSTKVAKSLTSVVSSISISRDTSEPNSSKYIASWQWADNKTKSFNVEWSQDIGNRRPDGTVLWDAQTASANYDNSGGNTTCSVTISPSNKAYKIKIRVKAVAEDTSSYNYTQWSKWTEYNVTAAPTTPQITIAKSEAVPNTFNVTVTNLKFDGYGDYVGRLGDHGNGIEIYIREDMNDAKPIQTHVFRPSTGQYSQFSCQIVAKPGHSYSAKIRSFRGSVYSVWSDYTEEVYGAPPVPSGFTDYYIKKKDGNYWLYLTWKIDNAYYRYRIKYWTYSLDSDSVPVGDAAQEIDVEPGINSWSINLGQSGTKVSVCLACSDAEHSSDAISEYTKPIVASCGTKPDAPTIWSSVYSCASDPESLSNVQLYWTHNSTDNTKQSKVVLTLSVEDDIYVHTIVTSEDDINYGKIQTNIPLSAVIAEWKRTMSEAERSQYFANKTISWSAITYGIINTPSDSSNTREIKVWATPTVSTSASIECMNDGELYTLPFKMDIIPFDGTNDEQWQQKPIGYNLSIMSDGSYVTVDVVGRNKNVTTGEFVYRGNHDGPVTNDIYKVSIGAGQVSLEDGQSYTVLVNVAFDSGLSAETQFNFIVNWAHMMRVEPPDANVIVDTNDLTASICPMCANVYERLIEREEDGQTNFYIEAGFEISRTDLLMSVYRREIDGTFTTIAEGIPNNGTTYVVDPHPSLDYARYRIVAMDPQNGTIEYNDISDVKVGEDAAVIQWSEEYSDFNVVNNDIDSGSTKSWYGTLLKLPYNLDVDFEYSQDVSLVKYLGRSYPVAYYGTQLGETQSWKLEIIRDDVQTLTALRHLAKYTGDVYIREPSGSGYWANVSVSFSSNHTELTIPVSIKITRVEGGI